MKSDSYRLALVGIAVLFLSIVLGGVAWGASEKKAEASANCDIQAGACVQALGDGSVTLEILPRPVTAMTDLTFQVTLAGVSAEDAPGIDLGMPGMSMGPNHVTLEETTGGGYTGTGVIVRCPSGKTLWQADVSIPGAGTVAFAFDVVY